MQKIVYCFILLFFSLQMEAQNVSGDNVVGAPNDSVTFTKVDVPASISRDVWVRHLTASLQPVVDSASKVLKPGTYTVMVRFIVETDGQITNVKETNDPGFGIGPLAADVVRRGPKWKPAKIGKRKVRSYYTQPVTFVITE